MVGLYCVGKGSVLGRVSRTAICFVGEGFRCAKVGEARDYSVVLYWRLLHSKYVSKYVNKYVCKGVCKYVCILVLWVVLCCLLLAMRHDEPYEPCLLRRVMSQTCGRYMAIEAIRRFP